MRRTTLAGGGLALLAFLAACGGSGYGSSSDTSSSSTPTPTATSTLATRDISGVGTVLTDSAGQTLYTSEQEGSGKVVCVDSCLQIWVPVTTSGGMPKAPASVADQIGTITRPDGGDKQLTYQGVPVYSFTLDNGAGQAQGNDVQDDFGGVSFTWHAVVVQASKGGATSSGGGYSHGGGYSY